MWNFILSLFRKRYDTGVIPDPRPIEKVAEDYLHEERVQPAEAADPFSNKRILESPYPYENQYDTSSCVAHGSVLALAIERLNDVGKFARLSPTFLYRLRANYPAAGSYTQDLFDKARKFGAPLYSSLPTHNTEGGANAAVLTPQMYTEAEIYRGNEYYTIEDPSNFQEIARVAQQGHGVAILIYATYAEWAVKIPFLAGALNALGAPIRHCICVLPRSGHTYLGKRYITVQDSAWFGGIKLRHVPEEFIRTRCYGAVYWDTVKLIGAGTRPMYTFSKTLRFGDTNSEVMMMQKLLIAEGLLPIDCATGYFGGRTMAGVRAFQDKYEVEILVPLKLAAPTNTWGSACIAKANQLCHGA